MKAVDMVHALMELRLILSPRYLASLNLCKPYSIVETSNINKMTTSFPKTETEYALSHTSSVETISEPRGSSVQNLNI